MQMLPMITLGSSGTPNQAFTREGTAESEVSPMSLTKGYGPVAQKNICEEISVLGPADNEPIWMEYPVTSPA